MQESKPNCVHLCIRGYSALCGLRGFLAAVWVGTACRSCGAPEFVGLKSPFLFGDTATPS